jgi:hypothetical protein
MRYIVGEAALLLEVCRKLSKALHDYDELSSLCHAARLALQPETCDGNDNKKNGPKDNDRLHKQAAARMMLESKVRKIPVGMVGCRQTGKASQQATMVATVSPAIAQRQGPHTNSNCVARGFVILSPRRAAAHQ